MFEFFEFKYFLNFKVEGFILNEDGRQFDCGVGFVNFRFKKFVKVLLYFVFDNSLVNFYGLLFFVCVIFMSCCVSLI